MFDPAKLKRCRIKKKLSGEQMCRELAASGLQISRQTLSSWENGDTFPNASQLAELAMFFDKPASFFFNLRTGRKKNEKADKIDSRRKKTV